MRRQAAGGRPKLLPQPEELRAREGAEAPGRRLTPHPPRPRPEPSGRASGRTAKALGEPAEAPTRTPVLDSTGPPGNRAPCHHGRREPTAGKPADAPARDGCSHSPRGAETGRTNGDRPRLRSARCLGSEADGSRPLPSPGKAERSARTAKPSRTSKEVSEGQGPGAGSSPPGAERSRADGGTTRKSLPPLHSDEKPKRATSQRRRQRHLEATDSTCGARPWSRTERETGRRTAGGQETSREARLRAREML